MRWQELPPLNALRAFAALAEAGSLSAAGSALNVSHAAISQQIRGLEERLEVRLVCREGRRIGLTPDGLTGWSAARSKRLGAAMLLPLLDFLLQ